MLAPPTSGLVSSPSSVLTVFMIVIFVTDSRVGAPRLPRFISIIPFLVVKLSTSIDGEDAPL